MRPSRSPRFPSRWPPLDPLPVAERFVAHPSGERCTTARRRPSAGSGAPDLGDAPEKREHEQVHRHQHEGVQQRPREPEHGRGTSREGSAGRGSRYRSTSAQTVKALQSTSTKPLWPVDKYPAWCPPTRRTLPPEFYRLGHLLTTRVTMLLHRPAGSRTLIATE